MKNYTTPRNLSEASFRVGYQTIYPTRRRSGLGLWAAISVAAVVAVAVMVG